MAQNSASKAAFVTGAASGIGAAIVSLLLERGARVVGADINEALLHERGTAWGEAFVGVPTDVTQEAAVERAVGTAIERFERLDAAFNVAGGARLSPIAETSEADWDFTVDLCLKGVFLCVKHEARRMTGGGAIVNIASLNAHVPAIGLGAYSAAKAATEMLTRNAALELAERGIRVNAILPGLVETPLTKPFFDNPGAKEAYLERIPLRRPAQPSEIAAPAVFLAGEEASYVSGSSLVVDGAWETSGYPDMRRWLGAFNEG